MITSIAILARLPSRTVENFLSLENNMSILKNVLKIAGSLALLGFLLLGVMIGTTGVSFWINPHDTHMGLG
jgi:hypothetical protein